MKSNFTKTLLKGVLPFGLSLLGHEIKRIILNTSGLSNLSVGSSLGSDSNDSRPQLIGLEQFDKSNEVFLPEAVNLIGWIGTEGLISYFWFLTMMMTIEILASIFYLRRKWSSQSFRKALAHLKPPSPCNLRTNMSEVKKFIMYVTKMTLLYSLCYLLYIATFLGVCSIFIGKVREQENITQQRHLLGEFRGRSLQSSEPLDLNQPLLDLTLTPTSSPIVQGLFQSLRLALENVVCIFSSDDRTMFVAITPENQPNMTWIKLEIYNISTKVSATYLSGLILQWPGNGDANLALSDDGKTLFLMMDADLQIIDISDLTSPQSISSFPQPINNDFVPDSLIYDAEMIIVATTSGVQVIDVSNVLYPIEAFIPVLNTENDEVLFSLSSDGKALFIGNGTNITIINITNIQSPQQITSIPYYGAFSTNLGIYEQTMFVYSFYTVDIWNISDLANPILVKHKVFNDSFAGFSPDYEIAYLNGNFSVQIVNVTDYSFSLISEIPLPDQYSSVVPSPDCRHILLTLLNGFLICDVSDPSSPISLPPVQVTFDIGFYGGTSDYVFSSNGQTFFTGFSLIQFALNIQASQALNFLENTSGTIPSNFQQEPASMAISPNNTILYLACNSTSNVQVINISDPNNYVWLPSLDTQLIDIQISSNGKYLFGISTTNYAWNSSFVIYSLVDSQIIYTFSIPDSSAQIDGYAISQDDSTAIVFGGYDTVISALDISNPTNVSAAYNLSFPLAPFIEVAFSSERKIAIIAYIESSYLPHLQIYNISTPSFPILISSSKWSDQIQAFTLSFDGTILFTLVSSNDSNDGLILNIIDISILGAPTIITTMDLFYPDLAASHPEILLVHMLPSGEVLFINLDGVLVAIDVSIRSLPLLVSSYQIQISKMTVSPDYSTLALINNSDVTIVSLKPQDILFLDFNQWALGASYPTAMNVLTKNSNGTYDAMINYKFTDLSLYTPTLYFTAQSETTLPNWITFDESTGYIAFSSESQSPLGFHIFSGSLSAQMQNSTFLVPGLFNNTNDSLSLLVTLITLGYVDNELYLTSSFNPNQPMLLTSEYMANETLIRQTLEQYYVVATTSIYIVSSLSIIFPDPPSSLPFTISTLSQEPLNIMISIGSNSSQPKFVSSDITFAASFSQDNSVISMVRSLLDINTALSQMVIYLNGSETCDGNITIIDGLNPTLYQFVPNISTYFRISSEPYINTSYFQSQVAEVSPETGEQFVIQFDSSTFNDNNSEPLILSLEMQDSNLEVPDWLNLKDLSLIGTPPDQLTGRHLDLKLTVSNQYQSNEVKFSLDISISLEYFLILTGKYIGSLITVIGLLIYAADIYNIVGKRFYTYSKDFVVRADQEIDSKVLYPIVFAKEPLHESKLIIRHLDKTVAKELKTSYKIRIAESFLSHDSYKIDRVRLVKAIEQAASEILEQDKTKLKIYTPVVKLEKELINQIIFNTFIVRLLDSDKNKATKKIFCQLKNKLYSLVELSSCLPDGSCTFSVIKSRLYSELRTLNGKVPTQGEDREQEQGICNPSSELDVSTSSENLRLNTVQDQTKGYDLETSLVYKNCVAQDQENFGVDIDFLVYVIKAYAFNHHIIDANVLDVNVVSRQQLPSRYGPLEAIRRFLKLDLQLIELSKNRIIGHGIEYNVKRKSLLFSGTADDSIGGKTLVLQIVTRRKRILRELWIYGVDNDPEKINLQEEVV